MFFYNLRRQNKISLFYKYISFFLFRCCCLFSDCLSVFYWLFTEMWNFRQGIRLPVSPSGRPIFLFNPKKCFFFFLSKQQSFVSILFLKNSFIFFNKKNIVEVCFRPGVNFDRISCFLSGPWLEWRVFWQPQSAPTKMYVYVRVCRSNGGNVTLFTKKDCFGIFFTLQKS